MTVLSSAATIVTISYFVVGTSSTRKFIRAKSTGSASFIPFAATVCNCIFWLKYGILCEDSSIIAVNGFGAVFSLLSCVIFYMYAGNGTGLSSFGISSSSSSSSSGIVSSHATVLVEKISVIYGVWIVFVLALVKYGSWWREDRGAKVWFMGWVCSIMTVLMFAAPLVSIQTVIRTKDSSVMSLPLTVSGLLVGLLWAIYGLDPFVYVTNGLGCVLSVLQLIVLFKYRKSSYEQMIPKGKVSPPITS